MSKVPAAVLALTSQQQKDYLFAAVRKADCQVDVGARVFKLSDLIAADPDNLNAKNVSGQPLLVVAVNAKNSAALDEILTKDRLPIINLRAVDGLGKSALDHALGLPDDIRQKFVEKIKDYAKYHSMPLGVGSSSVGRTTEVTPGYPGFSTARLDEFEEDAGRADMERMLASVSSPPALASTVAAPAFASQPTYDSSAFELPGGDGGDFDPTTEEDRSKLFATPVQKDEEVLNVAKTLGVEWWKVAKIALSQDGGFEHEVESLLPNYAEGEAKEILTRASEIGVDEVNAEIAAQKRAARLAAKSSVPSAPAFGSPGDFLEAFGGDGESGPITPEGRDFAAAIIGFSEVELAALACVHKSSGSLREKLVEAASLAGKSPQQVSAAKVFAKPLNLSA